MQANSPAPAVLRSSLQDSAAVPPTQGGGAGGGLMQAIAQGRRPLWWLYSLPGPLPQVLSLPPLPGHGDTERRAARARFIFHVWK